MVSHSERNFIFWQQWLVYTSILFAFAGLFYAVAGSINIFETYHSELAKIFWNESELPVQAEEFRRFAAGPAGGTIACAYIMMTFIAIHPFKEKKIWAWNAIAISTITWFVIDSAISFYEGVYIQVYLNVFSFVIKALPLLFTWKYFLRKSL